MTALLPPAEAPDVAHLAAALATLEAQEMRERAGVVGWQAFRGHNLNQRRGGQQHGSSS